MRSLLAVVTLLAGLLVVLTPAVAQSDACFGDGPNYSTAKADFVQNCGHASTIEDCDSRRDKRQNPRRWYWCSDQQINKKDTVPDRGDSAPVVTTTSTTTVTTTSSTAPTTTTRPTTTIPTSSATTTTSTPTGEYLVRQGQMRRADYAAMFGLPESAFQWSYDNAGTGIVSGPEGDELRVAHIPGNNASGTGTPINQAVFSLPPRRSYRVTQEVFFEPGWLWGPTNQSDQIGKVGAGFLGGTSASGGQINTAGFSGRAMWLRGSELSGYSYEATRTETYGHQNPTGVNMPVGRWFELAVEVGANSDISKEDGWFRLWVDGQLVLDRQGIGWQTSGENPPMVKRMDFVSFMGGSGQRYAPAETVYARYRNFNVG